jgi:hypothetical protein
MNEHRGFASQGPRPRRAALERYHNSCIFDIPVYVEWSKIF